MKKIDTETLEELKKIMAKILVAAFLISGSAKFALEKHYVKNIFSDKGLKITEEEANELLQMLEEESGNYNLDDEKDLVLCAVLENHNLTDTERKMVFKLVDLIEEMPYINKRMAYANLKKLFIKHHDESEDFYGRAILGQYSYFANRIDLYGKYANNSEDVLIHELIHSVFNNIDTGRLPMYFTEGVTELLEEEYFDEEPYWEDFCYPYEVTMIKILCDMVGSDLVLKAYATGDMKIIEDELAIYMGKDEAKLYLKNINKMFSQYFENGNCSLECMSSFLENTNNYFSEKYLESNEVFDSYRYNRELLIGLKNTDPSCDGYLEYLNENGYYIKPYFSKKLKETDKKHYQKLFECNLTRSSLD